MIKKTFLLLSLTMFIVSLSTLAGTGSGKVTRIYAHPKNPPSTGSVILFNVESHIDAPICSGNEWAFDGDTEHGKAMYALLLSAATQGKHVVITGANDCAAWHDRERPYLIYVDY